MQPLHQQHRMTVVIVLLITGVPANGMQCDSSNCYCGGADVFPDYQTKKPPYNNAHIPSNCTVLRIDGAEVRARGAIALAQQLKVNTMLKVLDLNSTSSWHYIGNRGATAIAEALKVNAVLKELLLNRNRVGDRGATAFAEALKHNAVLASLVLDNNNVKSCGAMAIAAGLGQ